MIKVPDIQDIQDVQRFANGAWYPLTRAPDGSVTSVIKIAGVAGNTVICHKYVGDQPGVTHSMTLNEFLSLDQGYYRSRMVDYGGSVLFIQNNGADERLRNHSYRADACRTYHNHYDVTCGFDDLPSNKTAIVALSTKRTIPSVAITKLEEGEIIGCALSDNFGLITSEKSDAIQIVRRSKVIGEVHNGEPFLKNGCEQYFYAVNKLWH